MQKLKAKMLWTDTMQSLRVHEFQPRLLYPAELSTTIDEGKRYSITKPELCNT